MKKTRNKIRASKLVKGLLLPVFDYIIKLWASTSLSYSSVKLAGGLLQGFYQV